MKEQELVSKYTAAQSRPVKQDVNESETDNILSREFNQE